MSGMKQVEVMRTTTEFYASRKALETAIGVAEKQGWAVRSIVELTQHKCVAVTFEDNR